MTATRQTLYFNEPVDLITPYQKAKQAWDQRIGSARVQAYHWRLIAFGLFGLNCLLSCIVFWQTQTSQIVPYIVEVSQKGKPHIVGPATPTYQPNDIQISFHLAKFITEFRSLSTDPIVVRNNWINIYHYVTDKAANTLTEYARQNDPFGDVGKKTKSIDVLSVVKASPKSFQVRWLEKTYINGSLENTQNFTSLMTLSLKPPTDKKVLLKNPLGIYIETLNWSKELK